jgi:hypothetical protein
MTADDALLSPKLSDFSTRRNKLVASQPRRAVRHAHDGWETKRILPGVIAWLVFYAIAVVGSLSATRPEAVTPPVVAALAGVEVAVGVR